MVVPGLDPSQISTSLAKSVYYCRLMSLKKLLLFLLIGFAIFFVVQSPNEAASLVKTTGETAGEWFESAAHAFSEFLTELV
jgi:large-conductance mechanosensitive channel